MTTSNRLAITELASTQTDRAATVNDAIAKLEAGATCFAAKQVSLNTPPGSPAEGDLYVVGTVPTGAWASNAKQVTVYYNAAWIFLPLFEGQIAYDQSTNTLYFYDASAWSVLVSAGGLTPASTTEQLTGTSTSKASTPDSVAALWEQGADVASAGTISFGEGGYFVVTGTTTITDIDFATDKAGRSAEVKFAGALTLTAGANLILPVSGNIVTAAGDTAEFVSEGSDVVRCIWYQRATGYPLNGTASTTEVLEGGNDKKTVTPDALAALWEAGADITDGAAITIGEGGYFNLITSTTAITSFVVTIDTTGRTFRVRFNTIRTLTHHATSLILPGGANITTATGDIAQFRSLGGGNVVCEWYTRASGLPLGYDTDTLKSDTAANLTAGFTATAYNAGTQSSGTYTPDPDNGNFQRAVNGGAHTLAPPAATPGDSLSMVIQYTNNGSAGTITTSGFTKVSGDALTTTNGDDFMFDITVVNGFSRLIVTALQ